MHHTHIYQHLSGVRKQNLSTRLALSTSETFGDEPGKFYIYSAIYIIVLVSTT